MIKRFFSHNEVPDDAIFSHTVIEDNGISNYLPREYFCLNPTQKEVYYYFIPKRKQRTIKNK